MTITRTSDSAVKLSWLEVKLKMVSVRKLQVKFHKDPTSRLKVFCLLWLRFSMDGPKLYPPDVDLYRAATDDYFKIRSLALEETSLHCILFLILASFWWSIPILSAWKTSDLEYYMWSLVKTGPVV